MKKEYDYLANIYQTVIILFELLPKNKGINYSISRKKSALDISSYAITLRF